MKNPKNFSARLAPRGERGEHPKLETERKIDMDTSRKESPRVLFGTSGKMNCREVQRWIAATDKAATERGYSIAFDIYTPKGLYRVSGCGIEGGVRLALAWCRHRGKYLVSAFKTEPEPDLFSYI